MFFKNKKGFSLIELIVTLAIMSVFLLILTPSVIHHIEESRMAKDEKTAADFTEIIESSLTDEDVYCEITNYVVGKKLDDPLNYSCYVDSESNKTLDKKEAIAEDSYIYNKSTRILDEVEYIPAGEMRGVTITFPIVENSIDYKNGRINEMVMGNRKGVTATTLLKDSSPSMVEFIKSKFGKTIQISSSTYKYSELTVFIYTGMPTTSEEKATDPVKVYNQWNGTNLG